MEQVCELAPDADEGDLAPPKTDDGLPMHEPKATAKGKPQAKAQMNFTDADSRIMESGGAFVQGYNCQAAVDDGHQIIVGQAEPVFGQIKEARRFRRFLLRGMANVQAEWALVCAGHNLLKLWRSQAMQLT